MEVALGEITFDELASKSFTVLKSYWEGQRAGRFAPAWRDIDLFALGGAVVPLVTVTDVIESPRDFIYRFWGTGHTEIKGVDNTGKSVRDHDPPSLGEIFWHEYDVVVTEKRPVAFRHDIREADDIVPRYQDVLRLPLSDDGVHVTNVISYADWRSSRESWKKLFDTPT